MVAERLVALAHGLAEAVLAGLGDEGVALRGVPGDPVEHRADHLGGRDTLAVQRGVLQGRTLFPRLAASYQTEMWVRLALALGLALAFTLWTLVASDSFYLRLSGGQEDFSSGRWASIAHWLALAGDRPWGLGLGAVRDLLAEGRPKLNGTNLLEWPHNEFVRFWVEAGPIGLLFVVLLLALLLRRAIRAARVEPDPMLRAMMLAIAADLLAEACLQNLLNAVYHATVLILILSLVTARACRPAEAPRLRLDRAGSPEAFCAGSAGRPP